MLGLLGPETIPIVLLIAVVLFGGSKIPQLARSLGRAKSEFQKGMNEDAEEKAEQQPTGKGTSESQS
jgi:sec-independent protein translocase protein TatA